MACIGTALRFYFTFYVYSNCDGLITRPEESYYRVSVCVCDQETPKREAKGPGL
jgi:hypothetical protein